MSDNQQSKSSLIRVIYSCVLYLILWSLSIYADFAWSINKVAETAPKALSMQSTDDDLSNYDLGYDTSSVPQLRINDPLEPLNRLIFNANEGMDFLVLKPTAKLYTTLIPQYGRDRIGCFLRNLLEPLNIVLNALTLNVRGVALASSRFAINTVFGVAGMYDIAASKWHMSNKMLTGDDLLARYGYPDEPYFILPLLGPASLRAAPGVILTYYLDPFNVKASERYAWMRNIATVVHYRSTILDLTNDISKVALDKYATMRSIYIQRQQYTSAKWRQRNSDER